MKIKLLFLFLGIGYTLLGQQRVYARYIFQNIEEDTAKYSFDLFVTGNQALSILRDTVSIDTSYLDKDENVQQIVKSRDKIGKVYYQNQSNRQLTFRDFRTINNKSKPCVVDEVLPSFNWEIKSKNRKIGSFSCALATTKFRGREYNVWFTTDVPVTLGPWKFNGLPGLIVEIKSMDNSISFLLEEIKTSHSQVVEPPVSGLKMTFKQYVDNDKKAVDDYIASIKAKLPRGAIVTVNSVGNNNIEKTFE